MRTFNIHAIGPSGAGKTVFMSSMYRQMSLRRPDSVFYLRTDHASSLQLNATYNTVAHPSDQWPLGTMDMHEWCFRVCVASPHGEFEPLEFHYLDYPGGILTNPNAARDPKVQKVIAGLRNAHALLALLNGADVLALMRGEHEGEKFLDFKITSTLEIVQQARCPVHFVVSKWDLLDGEFTLEAVRDRLMADQNFADVVSGHAADTGAPVRLFPVSSVGMGFAKLMPDGRMVKTGGRSRPFQVELPFESVIPDFFKYAFSEIEARESEILKRIERYMSSEPDSAARARWIARGRDMAAQFLAPMIRKALARRSPALANLLPAASDDLIDELFALIGKGLERRQSCAELERGRSQEELAGERQQVQDTRAALRLVQMQFHETLEAFVRDHPESLLAGSAERASDLLAPSQPVPSVAADTGEAT